MAVRTVPAIQALDRLRAGNRAFVASLRDGVAAGTPLRQLPHPSAQAPFAIILGCSDSRVPAELVFGQGFGDLFVIRVAGNIVAPSQVGSVEFAAARFNTRLAVVLGHSQCGAISATLEELRQPAAHQSPNLRSIVDRIRPAIEPLLGAAPPDDSQALVARAVRANIRAAVQHLRHGSALLERLVEQDGLVIVGAEYCLETGVVDFFDAPEPS
jgi:carbonic anhydrase